MLPTGSSCRWQTNTSVPSFWFPGSPEQAGDPQVFWAQAGHPIPSWVAHGGSLPPGPREFPPMYSFLHQLLTEPCMGYSLPFPFSPPAVQSPHIVSGLYSTSFMNGARDKNAMIILSELGDTHSQVCWAARCKKEVQGSEGWVWSFKPWTIRILPDPRSRRLVSNMKTFLLFFTFTEWSPSCY